MRVAPKSTTSPDMTRLTRELVALSKGMKGTEMTGLTITSCRFCCALRWHRRLRRVRLKHRRPPQSRSLASSPYSPRRHLLNASPGQLQVQELFPAYDPSRTSGGKVTFEGVGDRLVFHGAWAGSPRIKILPPERLPDIRSSRCDVLVAAIPAVVARTLWIANIKTFSTIAQRIDRSNARS